MSLFEGLEQQMKYEWWEVLIALRNPLSVVPTPKRTTPFVNAPWGEFHDKRCHRDDVGGL